MTYSSDHWVLEPCRLTDVKVIALARFQLSDYAVYLNPTDKRGYRSIVRLINNDEMISTINREYNSSERIGLSLLMSLITEAYTHIVPIVQNTIAGNNAHSFNSETGIVTLGTLEEPIFLHGHVFGRGNPEEKYIEDIPLDGPIPGKIFDMRAQSSHELGNDKKVNWKSGEMNKVVHRLRIEIEKICDIYKVHGLILITENVSTDIYIVRHGQTDWNIQRRLQGHTDIHLNEQGKQQARHLQEKFSDIHFTKIFSSDLTRARSTAQLIFDSNQLTVIETPLLREKIYGIMGRTFNYRFRILFKTKLSSREFNTR